ncbi:AbfB domain-containing protein [Roseateles noduli]|uniref:AbfB domain-containing protein n=1 Tax=Roseateles noduli TaxID=2052484 RepID=UPI003D645A2C
MKALAFRRPANGAIVVELRWINPWTDAQRINADSPSLERNGVPLHSGEIRNYVDRQPPSSAAYRLCLKNPVNAICSAPVTAGARGVEARFRTLDDRFMMHSGWMGFVDNVRNPEAAAHASFILRPGLDKGENTVSFESTAVPNHYFVNDRGRIVVRRIEDVPRFWRGASFIARAPLGAQPLSQFLSFEAVNERPGHFLRFIGNELRVTADDGTPAFKSSASFAQEDAFVPAQSSRLDTPGRPLPRRERQPTAPTKPICEAALAAPGRVPYNTVAMLLQRCIASKASPDRCERARQALDRGLPKATFQALMAQCIAGPDRPTP